MDRNRLDAATRATIREAITAKAVELNVHGHRERCTTEQRIDLLEAGQVASGRRLEEINDRELAWLDLLVDDVLSPF